MKNALAQDPPTYEVFACNRGRERREGQEPAGGSKPQSVRQTEATYTTWPLQLSWQSMCFVSVRSWVQSPLGASFENGCFSARLRPPAIHNLQPPNTHHSPHHLLLKPSCLPLPPSHCKPSNPLLPTRTPTYHRPAAGTKVTTTHLKPSPASTFSTHPTQPPNIPCKEPAVRKPPRILQPALRDNICEEPAHPATKHPMQGTSRQETTPHRAKKPARQHLGEKTPYEKPSFEGDNTAAKPQGTNPSEQRALQRTEHKIS